MCVYVIELGEFMEKTRVKEISGRLVHQAVCEGVCGSAEGGWRILDAYYYVYRCGNWIHGNTKDKDKQKN